MKLKTRFSFLSIGILFIPLLVVASSVLIIKLSGNEPETLQILRTSQQIKTLFEKPHPPPPPVFDDLDVIVLREGYNGFVVAITNIPELEKGEGLDILTALDIFASRHKDLSYNIRDITFKAGGRGLLLVGRGTASKPLPLRFLGLQITIAVFVAILLFTTILSSIFVRRLSKSISALEVATSSVAAGDLDFSLEVRGNDEMACLTRSFEAMRRSLKDEQERRAKFTMGVTHDLKTPLALIRGYVEALQDNLAVDENARQKYLQIIHDKTDKLNGMIDNLIDFVRMDRGEWELTHVAVPLHGFLRELCVFYAEDASLLGRQFEFHLYVPESVTIRMDKILVTRIFENLIGNALRYSEPGGRIRLIADQTSQGITISITNSGRTICRENLERIFYPFYRESSSREEPGFGLGLSIVKLIIDAHNWHIKVSSDRETTFTIMIPV